MGVSTKTIVITGASSGIGMQSAINLYSKGYKLILPCRNKESSIKIQNVFKDITNSSKELPSTPILNLSDLSSVEEFSKTITKQIKCIDVLILNAGLQYTGCKHPHKSDQGFELTFAVNHLSHFLLTNRLLPLLCKSSSARIVITSSEVHNPLSPGGRIGKPAHLGKLEGINNKKFFCHLDGTQEFNADKAYKDSKLCNILFGRELSQRLLNLNLQIPVICWAPGLVIPKGKGGFFRYSRKYNQLGQLLFAWIARDILHITESLENSGRILANIATDIKYDGCGFHYLSNRLIYPGKYQLEKGVLSMEAIDNNLASKLWLKSCDLIGISTCIRI